MWAKIKTWFDKNFSYSEQSELEKYLAGQEIHNTIDLEYYMALFDEKQRRLNKFWASGDMTGYRYEKQYF